MLNETSVEASQPNAFSSATICSTRAACRASSSRSKPSPCQSSQRSIRAPKTAATPSRVCTATRSAWPRSIRQMTARDTPARVASCRCARRRRNRNALTPRPKRMTSIPEGSRSAVHRHVCHRRPGCQLSPTALVTPDAAAGGRRTRWPVGAERNAVGRRAPRARAPRRRRTALGGRHRPSA